MNKLGTALLSASALLVAGTAAAELPEWTYGQLGYYQADSFGDEQTDGVTVDASVGFLDVWHFQAGYIDGSLGQGSVTNDFDGWNVTLGAHPAINDKSQLVVNGYYFDTSYDNDTVSLGSSIDRDGFGFGVGVRTNVTDKVEASAIANWTDATFDEDNVSDEDATSISVVLGGRYNWTKNFSTGATVVINDPVIVSAGSSNNSMNLDVRYTFAGLRL
jgi:hypothetical protein